METVEIPKEEYEQMKNELETLRNSEFYKRLVERLIECKKNISQGKKYTREDLGL